MSPALAFLRGHAAWSSLILGAIAACGFAPLALWPLTILAFALWLALIGDARSLRSALWRGWVFGVGHFTINDNWFQHAFDFQDKMPPVLGYFAAVALALYLAVYPMLAAGIAWRWRGRRADWSFALMAGAAWTATEWLRGVMFTGYAWDPLGVIWVPVQPVASLTAFIGTYALSGLTIAAAGALLIAWRYWSAIGAVVAAFAVLLVAQAFSYPSPPRSPMPANTPRLRIVQPNVSQDQRGQSDGELLLARLTALSGRPGPAPRLVLWPEGVVRYMLEDGYPRYAYGGMPPSFVRQRIASVLGPDDLLMTGGESLNFAGDDVVSATNAIYAIAPGGDLVGRYDKAHLVPYGEYLPMPWLLRPLGLARLVPGDFDFKAGPGPRNLTLPGFGEIGIQLCYEIVFSGEVVDSAHRPSLIFNPSNDAWFGRWGPPQHLAQARIRAIEEGLPIVRATPTGISAVIAADGRLIAIIPYERRGAIEVPMPTAASPTLFSKVGNWMAAIVATAMLATAVALRRRAR